MHKEGGRLEAHRGDRRRAGLFKALFSGEVLRLYERCLDQIEGQPYIGLRIELMMERRAEPQVAPLQDLPWEAVRAAGHPGIPGAQPASPSSSQYLAVPPSLRGSATSSLSWAMADFAAAEGSLLWFERPDRGGDPIRGEDLG